MTHDPLDLRGQEKAVEDAELKAKLAAKLEEDDLKWLASGKRGRRILHRQLEMAGVWRLSFNTNAMTMAFNEGMRNQGLRLVAMLMSVCPESYALMLTENRRDV